MTQLLEAKKGYITKEMEFVANEECIPPEKIMNEIAAGRLVIPSNIYHKKTREVGIGRILKCKINANIGRSSHASGTDEEMRKLDIAINAGADAVMDLSTGPDISPIRKNIVKNCSVPLGTVPMYQAVELVEDVADLTEEHLLNVIEEHAKDGVDFMTIHCGIKKSVIPLAEKRVLGIVSRGGSLLVNWMRMNNKENPTYTRYDDILEICRKYDVTLSLGDGLRPGCLADASDDAQFSELEELGKLARRANDAGVQVMIEGPGHVPFNQIEMNMKKEIELCNDAPFYVLGPLVTDIAAGHDHIASAIGGTMAAYSGASMLCYVTPKEHLGLPTEQDVKEGVIAHKIAAHAADVALGRINAQNKDNAVSKARANLNWNEQFKHYLDPETALSKLDKAGEKTKSCNEVCSMCGPKFCAIRLFKEGGQNDKNG